LKANWSGCLLSARRSLRSHKPAIAQPKSRKRIGQAGLTGAWDALDREQLELMQEVKAFVAAVDAKLTQLLTLLAQRPPLDPPPRPN
jgi:hypothetical protein